MIGSVERIVAPKVGIARQAQRYEQRNEAFAPARKTERQKKEINARRFLAPAQSRAQRVALADSRNEIRMYDLSREREFEVSSGVAEKKAKHMPRTHKPYDATFRQQAVEPAQSSGKPYRDVARDLGVSVDTLRA